MANEGEPIPVAKIRQFQCPYDGPPLNVLEEVLREDGFMLMDFEPCDPAGMYVLYVATYGQFMEAVARYQIAMQKAADRSVGLIVTTTGKETYH